MNPHTAINFMHAAFPSLANSILPKGLPSGAVISNPSPSSMAEQVVSSSGRPMRMVMIRKGSSRRRSMMYVIL
jgi:hypothetical protein